MFYFKKIAEFINLYLLRSSTFDCSASSGSNKQLGGVSVRLLNGVSNSAKGNRLNGVSFCGIGDDGAVVAEVKSRPRLVVGLSFWAEFEGTTGFGTVVFDPKGVSPILLELEGACGFGTIVVTACVSTVSSISVSSAKQPAYCSKFRKQQCTKVHAQVCKLEFWQLCVL